MLTPEQKALVNELVGAMLKHMNAGVAAIEAIAAAIDAAAMVAGTLKPTDRAEVVRVSTGMLPRLAEQRAAEIQALDAPVH